MLRLLTLIYLLLLTACSQASPLEKAWPNTDFAKRSISLESLRSGGPGRDGIPAIDQPHFTTPQGASSWLKPEEPVITISHQGEAKAYPLQILIWHEIVNDRIGDTPILVTFCPLCNAALVFHRVLDGQELSFGVSGLLRHSDMIMYDRRSESLWQQFTGAAVIGKQLGRQLPPFPSTITSFALFGDNYPNGQVLSRQTGHSRDYGRNPYRGYDRLGSDPFLLDDPADPRLPAMAHVLGITLDGQQRAYNLETLDRIGVKQDRFMGQPLLILSQRGLRSALGGGRTADGRPILQAAIYNRQLTGHGTLSFTHQQGNVVDQQTGSHWNLMGEAVAGPLKGERLEQLDRGVHFAFAWLVFHPRSEVVK
uniref:DUF3179 domain-containing protein n=1 Tax=Magnetococcus massalia (strain MO-1) TaxID=451514 RepID=A0A1S7LK14_MAGMO|nr:conserved exported protein of unknown function [Candidatus Magnetococcus massalia]